MNTFPHLTRLLWRCLMVVTILVSIGAAQAAPLPCGVPSYNAASDRAIFLWRDCATGSWSMRAMGGGNYATFSGELNATLPFASYAPVLLETHDVLQSPVPTRIQFNLQTWNDGIDGFNFIVPVGANVCFSLATTDIPVLAGPSRVPMETPFDLATLGPCVAPGKKLNLIVFLTDDQRFDTLWAMPNVQSKLIARGVEFQRAYVHTPLCCPTRASILSGGFYAKNTGVLMNEIPLPNDNGGVKRFNDRDTIALTLQAQGYQTMLVGKYINGFYSKMPGYPQYYVPPGWSRFIGAISSAVDTDWYQMKFLVGSSGQTPSTGREVGTAGQYVADYQRDQVLRFIDDVGDTPFFLYLSFNAPHLTSQPAEQDKTLFANYVYRGRSYGESDLSDKPTWVSDPTKHVWLKHGDDEQPRNELRSLQAADRAIGAVVDALERQGKLNDTLMIFTSDNGYLWGEHGLFFDKGLAYEETVRVPFVAVMPGVGPRLDKTSLVHADLDIGPTLYDLAGADRHADGASLVPLLRNPATPWRSQIVLQEYGFRAGCGGAWGALVTSRWKYIQHVDGQKELYDLVADPFEMSSLHADPAHSQVLANLAAALQPELGLQITTLNPVQGRVGRSYSYQMKTWGAQGTLTWKEVLPTGSASKLPRGLTLNAATGRLQGTPTLAGTFQTKIVVTDSVLATQRGDPRRFIIPLTVTITPP